MILPPGSTGVAFSQAGDGDLRGLPAARKSASAQLGISADWASLRQVHGNRVLRVSKSGVAGDADAIWTATPSLPVAVFTADCYGVVLVARSAVGVAHVGWRGARDSTVSALRLAMASSGYPPTAAYVGPGIGPCCFEVGDDVAPLFPDAQDSTKWGSISVDLEKAVRTELAGLDVWSSGDCTFHDEGFFSHRRDADKRRLVSVAWLP